MAKARPIECRLIVQPPEGGGIVDRFPGLTEAGMDWFELCGEAADEDVGKRAMFVRAVETYQPDIVELAANIVQHGQLTPVAVRKANLGKGLKGYKLLAGRRRLMAAHYNACKIGAKVARIIAEVEE